MHGVWSKFQGVWSKFQGVWSKFLGCVVIVPVAILEKLAPMPPPPPPPISICYTKGEVGQPSSRLGNQLVTVGLQNKIKLISSIALKSRLIT